MNRYETKRDRIMSVFMGWDLFEGRCGNGYTNKEINNILDLLTDIATEPDFIPCPIHQCGGELIPVEDWRNIKEDDWQTPLLKCNSCHGLYQFLRFENQ